ncbi:MAG: N-formylglutamate amidohydrolase [Pseudorhodobacter sp.]|nr:N-formylglutamate amidohydrolase [Pseudorhodobacter sp.]
MTESFTLLCPALRTTSVIFSSPHSGRDYPAAFLAASALDPQEIRSSEDAFVDLLFASAPIMGAPLLAARVPRAYIDLNRACDELDPGVIDRAMGSAHNPRISSGLGVIPRVVANGRVIHRGKISLAAAEARIATVWHPYHAALRELIAQSHASFGEAIVVDCHSMPHEAIEAHTRPGTPRPEVVLGDRYGAAAGREVVEHIAAAFADAGLRVGRNAPFSGAYIAQAYGHPAQQRHVVQIEIDRALYMNEAAVVPGPDFAAFQALMAGVVAEIAALGRRQMPLAAE